MTAGGGMPGAERPAWLVEGAEILGRQSAASWEFADFLAGDSVPAGMKDTDLADALEISRQKIGEYRAVSRAYSNAIRMAPPLKSLNFTHYRIVFRLPEADRERLLAEAAAGGWSAARLREAAREASAEGKLRRQAAEIRELRRQLKALKTNPRDAAAQVEARLAAEVRVIRDAARRLPEPAEEIATSGVLEGLHGNARRGLARGLRQKIDKAVVAMNDAIGRIEAAAERIEAPMLEAAE